MADDGSKPNAIWPLPKFSFRVQFGSLPTPVEFQEVSSLDLDTQVMEYRHDSSPVFSTVKMPGVAKYGNVTMKKGVFAKDNTFWDWYSQINMNTLQRETVTIELLDERGTPTITWTLQNAFPTKITGMDVISVGNEVTVETLEIAYEGLTIKQL